ncbi:excalibur calcium-binding domain-containing protein [Rhodococcus ruber]|uniref:Excalibur calcium-binding domain-containing protein n=1 Tax=Rhodococcus ruber TaxID=1830 RepID=A0ABT4MK58_9NOCA|nr:excalibur calcium-binding domain-containing protein [Rhodococcus ruber]MCZ4521074.1 excalibur calcium-binding domain-containing protein [Rhodococcus ruber]
MTSAYPPPFQRPAPEPETPRRPLFGKVFAWVAIVFGVIFLIGALVSFEFGALLVGALMVGAGVAYLYLSPSRGRRGWAVPAIAVLPALIVMGLTTTTEPETPAVAPVAAVPALPTVTTTSAPPSTTTPTPTTTTTVAPTTEAVAAIIEVPTTSEYIPLPDPEPVYIPEPAYTPEPVYTAPAPLVAVPPVVSYANCDAVRAAGAAPIYAGEPGYSSKLDRDKDGIGCDT